MIVPHIVLPFVLTFSFLFIATKGGKGGKGRPKGAHTPDKTPADLTPGDPTPEEPEIR